MFTDENLEALCELVVRLCRFHGFHDLASPWERPQPARLHKIMAEGSLVWPPLALVVENFIKGHMGKQVLGLTEALAKHSQASLKSQGSIRETCAWHGQCGMEALMLSWGMLRALATGASTLSRLSALRAGRR